MQIWRENGVRLGRSSLPGHRDRPIPVMSSSSEKKWSTAMGKIGPSCRSNKALASRSPVPRPTRVEKTTASAPLDQAWSYPLFETIYGRRSRRFGLGFEMRECARAPVPLTELEEALLVGAGAGFTGLAFWHLPTPPPYSHLSGRTFPTTRAGGHAALFWTNDEGFYVLDDKVAASKLREVETKEARGTLGRFVTD